MSARKLPIVAIVGQANVGKSSLFNSILKRREAITADQPGTTRDPVWAKAIYRGKSFWIVDTAGMKDPEDDFEYTVQEQIDQAAESADIIIFTIDSSAPISDEERRLAKKLLKTKKQIILAANKSDKNKNASEKDFSKLGIKDIYLTSTTQNSGISSLLDHIQLLIPSSSDKTPSNKITMALVGRPNVGKSYLFNTMLKKQEAIVSGLAGTTRDINRRSINYKKTPIVILDTAGIRRSGRIEQGVERFSVLRSLSAIEQADICALVIDINEPATQLDQKIAGMVKEAGKGLIIVISKWDSADKDAYTRDSIAPRIKHEFDFVPWAPLIFTSAVSGQNVTKIFELVMDIYASRKQKIKTSSLNTWLSHTIDSHPPAGLKNKNPKLHYIVQESDSPTNFKVYGSDTKFLHWSYKRFMERRLREEYGFEGTPIRFWFFDRKDNK